MIHGAGGAVGSVAVQLARSVGAHVIGTGRNGARSRTMEAGADSFVDLEQDRWGGRHRRRVVLDTIGGEVLARSAAIVTPGGALVSVCAPPPTDRQDIRALRFVREPSGAQLVELARLVGTGQLRPQVERYPLADAREAFMAKSTERIPGKVILQP